MSSIRKIVVIILLIVAGKALYAQSLSTSPFGVESYRAYFGSNLSNLTYNPPAFSSRGALGYQFGTDLEFGKMGHFYFQPGLQYSNTTINFSHPSLTDKESKLSVGGIKIPMLLGYNLLRNWEVHRINVRFFTGPSFMAIVKVKHKDMDNKKYILTDKNYHDVEWAWHVGSAIQVHKLFIEVGYQTGLTYVFTGVSEAKSNQLYVNVGMRLLRGCYMEKRYYIPNE